MGADDKSDGRRLYVATLMLTLLGGVKVDGTTIKAAPDGTISTTVVPLGDNRIINGDMRIEPAQWSGGSGTANGYTVDRWQYAGTQAGKVNWQRGGGGPLAFGYILLHSDVSFRVHASGERLFFVSSGY